MGTTLTGTTPQDTYDSLIKVTDNGPLSGTLKALSDGLGNDSTLSLSTTAASIAGTLAVAGVTTFSSNVGLANAFSLTGRNAANTLSISLISRNASDRVVIDPDGYGTNIGGGGTVLLNATGGNVGIGTSAPSEPLVVSSTIRDYAGGSFSTFLQSTTAQSVGRGGSLGFGGETGVGIASFGAIIGAKENSTSAETGGYLAFTTRANGGALTEKVRILSSGGITFNGDTAAANALDDYEEGTFTPTVEGSSTAGTATYSVQIGKYTKIGNQISILIDLAWSGGTGTGILRIVGLPFTNVAFNTAGTIGFIDSIALTALNYATMYVAPSSTRLDFVQSPTGGGSVTDVSYDAAGRLIVSATYFNA